MVILIVLVILLVDLFFCFLVTVPPPSAHQLPDVLGRPPDLRERQAALDALEVLSGDLVAHDVAALAVVQLLARAALVDAHHGHADGPRRLADAQPEVPVVGVDVPPLLRRPHDLHHRVQDRVVQVALFELAEELFWPLVVCSFVQERRNMISVMYEGE